MKTTRISKTAWRGAALAAAMIVPGVLIAAENLTPEAEAAKAIALEQMSGDVQWKGPESSPAPIPGKRNCRDFVLPGRRRRCTPGPLHGGSWRVDGLGGRCF